MAEPLDHLNVVGYSEARSFKSTLVVKKKPVPTRERLSHGQRLLRQLEDLARVADQLAQRREQMDLPSRVGMTLAIEISPKGLLDYQTLEWRRDGIEILNVTQGEASDVVLVHVPEGRLAAFEKRVREYLEKATKKGNPRNASLVNVIENFRRAAFDELWTDALEPPATDTAQWFQLWLRIAADGPSATHSAFAIGAEQMGIVVESGYVPFPGRVVVAAYTTRAVLEQAIELLDVMAEIRSVPPTAEFFLSDLKPGDQVQWVRDLESRLQFSDDIASPYVTLLDTGVNHAHPLISQSLEEVDLHAVDPTWPRIDNHGHGTQMAGIVLHGNLTEALASSISYDVPHRLESVNIFPPVGENGPHLYGWITEHATRVVEKAQPERRRTFAMMTTCTGATTGLPSEWSATLDRLAFGSSGTLEVEDEATASRRLFVLSCGNVPWPDWAKYPNINDLTAIESPAQSWNALTVGAHTDLTHIESDKWPSLSMIASGGALSPCSTTSLLWRRTWPFKPDVVAEGGNGSMDAGQPIVGPESLRLLTTHHDMMTSLLTETGDTSAASAEVARLCGHLSARYPDYWPETIRALVVHGARYTPAMRALLPLAPVMTDKEGLLRRFGYGAVNADNALHSTSLRPTLVLQETLNPYRQDGADIKLNEVNMHALPWPAAELLALGGVTVEMRVTLSYFIDPNPSQRGWQSKFRYQSHGLRFAVKGATETPEVFGQRINRIEREEAAGDGPIESMQDPDSQGWLLGTKLQSRGSLHSDMWRGTAAQLAEKSHLAVFPVGGWWKDWKEAARFNRPVHYALVVSLEVSEQIDIDLYTPILAQIRIPVVVPIPT